MRIVLDEGVPNGLTAYLRDHEVQTVDQLGAKGVKDGRLLKLVASLRIDVFITADKSLHRQNQLCRYPFGTLMLSTNSWPIVERNAESIARTLEQVKPGAEVQIDCGKFVPRRYREKRR